MAQNALNSGKFVGSGDSATTVFSIPHGMDAIPDSFSVEGGNLVSIAAAFGTLTATAITYTFTVAPTTGTNNVILWWITT